MPSPKKMMKLSHQSDRQRYCNGRTGIDGTVIVLPLPGGGLGPVPQPLDGRVDWLDVALIALDERPVDDRQYGRDRRTQARPKFHGHHETGQIQSDEDEEEDGDLHYNVTGLAGIVGFIIAQGLPAGHFSECWNPNVYGFVFCPLDMVITSNPLGEQGVVGIHFAGVILTTPAA